jgi:hypothetical protein
VPTPEILVALIAPLNRIRVPYFVTGSVASIVYGEPRLTHDVDLVLRMVMRQIGDLVQAFPEDEYYCPPPEVLEVETTRPSRGHFNIIHYASGFRADIYLMGDDPLHAWAMQRRRKVDLSGHVLWVAPPEYVIVRKLEYFREGGSDKHLRDIEGIFAGVGEDLDVGWIEGIVSQRSLEKEWGRVRARPIPKGV